MSEFGRSSPASPLDLASTLNLLAGVANHEAKSLFLIYLGETVGLKTKAQMEAGFRDFVGSSEVWIPSKGSLEQYCEDSLGPVGSVVEGRLDTARRQSKAFRITERGRNCGLPVAGLMLDWGLKHPNISAQDVIGPTLSASDKRAVEARSALFSELITTNGIASVKTAAHRYDSLHQENTFYNLDETIRRAAKVLVKAGVLEYDSSQQVNDSIFNITNYSPEVRGGPPRSLVTQSVYEFIQALQTKGNTTFTFSECLDFSMRWVRQRDASIDPATIKQRLTSRLGDKGSIKGIERQSTFNSGHATRIIVASEHRPAIKAFVEMLEAVADNDQPTIDEGRQHAREISQDPKAKRELMMKADRFSSHTGAQPKYETMQRLFDLVRSAPQPMDAETVANAYERAYGQSIKVNLATSYLTAMSLGKAAVLKVEKKRPHEYNKKARNFYSSLAA